MSTIIKIAMIDDHELFLRGLKKLLNKLEDINIEAEFEDGKSLLAALPFLEVDLLLLDLQLPDIKAEDLLIKIQELQPDLPILYLTMMRGARNFRKLEKHNIGGYILKDSSLDELHRAIKITANGGHYYSKDIYLNNDINANTVTTPKEQLKNLLSPREQEVLVLICKEHSSAEIAKKLYVSTSTIDTHRKKILIKLGVNNTVGLVKYAIKYGIFDNL